MQITPDKGYNVKEAYHFLTAVEPMHWSAFHNVIWNKAIMLKVSICASCLLQNRLPTKDNLVKCGIIQHNANVCVSGIIQPLIFGCNVFGSLWLLIRQ